MKEQPRLGHPASRQRETAGPGPGASSKLPAGAALATFIAVSLARVSPTAKPHASRKGSTDVGGTGPQGGALSTVNKHPVHNDAIFAFFSVYQPRRGNPATVSLR